MAQIKVLDLDDSNSLSELSYEDAKKVNGGATGFRYPHSLRGSFYPVILYGYTAKDAAAAWGFEIGSTDNNTSATTTLFGASLSN